MTVKPYQDEDGGEDGGEDEEEDDEGGDGEEDEVEEDEEEDEEEDDEGGAKAKARTAPLKVRPPGLLAVGLRLLAFWMCTRIMSILFAIHVESVHIWKTSSGLMLSNVHWQDSRNAFLSFKFPEKGFREVALKRRFTAAMIGTDFAVWSKPQGVKHIPFSGKKRAGYYRPQGFYQVTCKGLCNSAEPEWDVETKKYVYFNKTEAEAKNLKRKYAVMQFAGTGRKNKGGEPGYQDQVESVKYSDAHPQLLNGEPMYRL